MTKKFQKVIDSKHESMVRDIIAKPYLIGIEGVQWAAQFTVRDGHRTTEGADIVFFTGRMYQRECHVVECKADIENGRKKAVSQLYNTARFLMETWGYRAYMHIAHKKEGLYEVQTLQNVNLNDEYRIDMRNIRMRRDDLDPEDRHPGRRYRGVFRPYHGQYKRR